MSTIFLVFPGNDQNLACLLTILFVLAIGMITLVCKTSSIQ